MSHGDADNIGLATFSLHKFFVLVLLRFCVKPS